MEWGYRLEGGLFNSPFLNIKARSKDTVTDLSVWKGAYLIVPFKIYQYIQFQGGGEWRGLAFRSQCRSTDGVTEKE